jgi:hypothetical protein
MHPPPNPRQEEQQVPLSEGPLVTVGEGQDNGEPGGRGVAGAGGSSGDGGGGK